MQAPEKPGNETMRLQTLRALNILDTSPEERFDRLTRLARRLFGVSIALVSLVDADRQWFKSAAGLDVTETSCDISFCGHAILQDDVFVIPDASLDARFHDNPLVTDAPNIRFYAGCPLMMTNGSKLGTLCLIDQSPRSMNAEDLGLLRDLARMAEQEISAMQMATIDDLTLLSNRRGFEAMAQHALNLCRRLDKPASLFFFDLDRFKQINDRFGHAEGDYALNAFAQILKRVLRDSDVIGRLGGDEFAAFLTNATQAESEAALTRLQEEAARYNLTSRRGYDLCYSVGQVAFDHARHLSIDDLTEDADRRMYANKNRRRAAVAAIASAGAAVAA